MSTPQRPRLLDLFCGAGGASVGYARAGFAVEGVDLAYQRNYPYRFHHRDALLIDRDWAADFDAIAASPPCLAHTVALSAAFREWYTDLLPATRMLLEAIGRPYVIENVPGAPLLDPVLVCGTALPPLRVIRHRMFESNVPLAGTGCRAHPRVMRPSLRRGFSGGHVRRSEMPRGRREDPWREFLTVSGWMDYPHGARMDAMGVDWRMTRDELCDAIPPPYTEFLGRQLLEHL